MAKHRSQMFGHCKQYILIVCATIQYSFDFLPTYNAVPSSHWEAFLQSHRKSFGYYEIWMDQWGKMMTNQRILKVAMYPLDQTQHLKMLRWNVLAFTFTNLLSARIENLGVQVLLNWTCSWYEFMGLQNEQQVLHNPMSRHTATTALSLSMC